MNETGQEPITATDPDAQPTQVLGRPDTSPLDPTRPITAAGDWGGTATAAGVGAPTPPGPTQPGPSQPGPTPPAAGWPSGPGYPGAGYPTGNPGGYGPGQPSGGYGTGSPAGGYPTAGYSPGAIPPVPGRRLTRSRSDRMIAGVCGGLARYWNTDPVLLRILTVVLTLATGGAFLIGYIIAWIAIPEEPGAPGSYPPGSYPPADQAGYAAGGNPPYAQSGSQYMAPAPRERSFLGWLVVSAAVLLVGVVSLVAVLAPSSVAMSATAWGVALAVALTVLGVGLLVGTWFGRARWLAVLAVPLAFVTFGVIATTQWVQDNPNWNRWSDSDGLTVGDRNWVVPASAAGGPPLTYELSAGDAVLDLTQLTAIGAANPGRAEQRVDIDAGVGLGQLVVLIPDDLVLDLSATVDVGAITVPGTPQRSGNNLDMQTTVEQRAGEQPAFIVNLDAAIGAGNLEVRREAA